MERGAAILGKHLDGAVRGRGGGGGAAGVERRHGCRQAPPGACPGLCVLGGPPHSIPSMQIRDAGGSAVNEMERLLMKWVKFGGGRSAGRLLAGPGLAGMLWSRRWMPLCGLVAACGQQWCAPPAAQCRCGGLSDGGATAPAQRAHHHCRGLKLGGTVASSAAPLGGAVIPALHQPFVPRVFCNLIVTDDAVASATAVSLLGTACSFCTPQDVAPRREMPARVAPPPPP